MRVALLILAAVVLLTPFALGQTVPPATQPSEVDRLQRENAELRKAVADLHAQVQQLVSENARLKKQWNDAVRGGSAPQPGTQPKEATKIEQDGPGLYRLSAGPNGRFTRTVRAKSRDDALDIALKTVAQEAMRWDENVEIKELKVERIGN